LRVATLLRDVIEERLRAEFVGLAYDREVLPGLPAHADAVDFHRARRRAVARVSGGHLAPHGQLKKLAPPLRRVEFRNRRLYRARFTVAHGQAERDAEGDGVERVLNGREAARVVD